MSRSRVKFWRISGFVLVGGWLLTGLGLGVGFADTAGAVTPTSGREQITRYDVLLTARPDGSMHVRETIDYDFGGRADRHGIERIIPVEFAYNDKYHRMYPVSNVKASSPDAPADLAIADGSTVTLRIGDKNETVDGVHTYVIDYDVDGVINTLSSGQELYWNAIGSQWTVPISHAGVVVQGPVGVVRVACFEGAQASTQECAHAVAGNGSASFGAPALEAYQGMTIVAGFRAGAFPGAHPILVEPWSIQHAFSVTPVTVGGAVGLFALLAGGVIALVARRGRDERYLGVTPGLAPGLGQSERVARVGAFRRDPVAVQFTPPKDLRVGELGTLIDEQANVVDVTATIVDLAVRGYLRIEEIEAPGWLRGGDWKLVQLTPTESVPLRDYENVLLSAIFEGRGEVLLSDLKQTFSSSLKKVQGMLYDEVTRRRWFRGNPSSVRSRFQALGFFLILAGVGLTWLLAARTSFGLIGVAAVLGGLVMLVNAPRMPARTAAGTALLAQAKGFRSYLETAEANQIKFEEGQDVFSRYLPYAIVFGVAERWAGVFAQLAASGVDVGAPAWYVGSAYNYGLGAAMFDYNGFGRSMDSFATTTSGSIAAATPSSSGSSGFDGGGFSGGGGGGGGGGSW